MPAALPPGCSGLPKNVTEEQVGAYFGQIGTIKQDKKRRKPKVRCGWAGRQAPPASAPAPTSHYLIRPTICPRFLCPGRAGVAVPGQGDWRAEGRRHSDV